MPKVGGYRAGTETAADELKRRAGGKGVSYNNTNRMPMSGPGGGKFGSGQGNMNGGGKKRPGRPGPGLSGTAG